MNKDSIPTPAKNTYVNPAKYRGLLEDLLRSNVTRTTLRNYVGDDSLELREDAFLDSKYLIEEIAGANPSALEYALSERIATCYAFCCLTEGYYLEHINGQSRIGIIDYWANQCDRATKRLTRSIDALIQVRRLQSTSLQINVADKQVNLSTTK